MKVDRDYEKFIYHLKNLACCCLIRVHQFVGSRMVRCVEVLPEHMRSHIFLTRQECHAYSDKFSSRVGDLNLQVWRRSCSQT
jgi:hypothetical protein